MAESPFSQENLRKTVQDLPPEQGGIGVAVKPNDIGVTGSVNKQIGKGWSVSAAGQWWSKTKDYVAGAWLTWKGQ